MKDYMTVQEAAEKWSISERRVQILCTEGRVEGAVKHASVWAIPVECQKPENLKPGKKANNG